MEVGEAHQHLPYKAEYDKCKERVKLGLSMSTGGRTPVQSWQELRLWRGGGFGAGCMSKVELVGKYKTFSGNSQQSSLGEAQSIC